MSSLLLRSPLLKAAFVNVVPAGGLAVDDLVRGAGRGVEFDAADWAVVFDGLADAVGVFDA